MTSSTTINRYRRSRRHKNTRLNKRRVTISMLLIAWLMIRWMVVWCRIMITLVSRRKRLETITIRGIMIGLMRRILMKRTIIRVKPNKCNNNKNSPKSKGSATSKNTNPSTCRNPKYPPSNNNHRSITTNNQNLPPPHPLPPHNPHSAWTTYKRTSHPHKSNNNKKDNYLEWRKSSRATYY